MRMLKLNIYNRFITCLLIVFFSTTLTGCWDQRVYEKIGFILDTGIESSKDKDNKLLLTYSTAVVGIGKKNQIELISDKANLLREGRENIRTMSARPIEAGKIQQILFSRELAEKGEIHNLTSIFSADPINPALAFLAIVDGSPKELLEMAITFEDKPRAPIYINQLLESNSQDSKTPETRIYNFETAYFAPGLDPVVPMIKLVFKEIRVVGSALFSESKMVGHINTKQTTLLLAMMNKVKKAEYIFKLPKLEETQSSLKQGAAVAIRKVKRKISTRIENNKPVINISLNLDGVIDEYKWNSLGEKSSQQELEIHMSDEIKSECANIIKYAQAVGSDPMGIGDIIRAKHNAYWKSVNWKEVYKNAEISVDAKFNIIQHGLIK